jgi:predicted dehydrogenase
MQGKRHAAKFAALDDSKLVAVVDIDAERARRVADELGVAQFTDFRDLPGEVDAVAIATPTPAHFEIANTLLNEGIHVLLEKPFTTTMDEARALVEVAEGKGLVLQIGHLERFNPAIVALAAYVSRPQFIESHRIAPYKPRSLDVSVVLDLMIHDIDLIHGLVGAPMEHVDAIGRSVFSENIDVANARIRFANRCVANVTSSRISLKTERSLRVFQADAYLSADMHEKVLATYTRRGDGPVAGPDDVRIEKHYFEDNDAMLEQARAFLASVRGGPPPLVSGRTAMESLRTALAIGEAVGEQQLP